MTGERRALRVFVVLSLSLLPSLARAQVPVRQFMTRQIQSAGNDEDIFVFTDAAKQARPKTWDEVGMTSLIPAFILSELKVAFIMGFKIFLPFLMFLDLVHLLARNSDSFRNFLR